MNFQNNLPNTEAKGKISVDELRNEQTKLKKQDILGEILQHIQRVNFREKAGLKAEGRVESRHTIVVTVDNVIEVASRIGFGLCKLQGSLYAYNNEYWEPIEEDRFRNFLGMCADKMGVRTVDSKYHRFRKELYEQFLEVSYLPTLGNEYGKVFINLLNGTFEITPEQQKLREFKPTDFLTYQLPFGYKPDADCLKFKAFLQEVQPDISSQNVLAEFVASVFISRKRLKLEKALMLYGSGANGKSVFFDIIQALLGKQNVSSIPLDKLTDDTGYSRAEFTGKLLNYSSEISRKVDADRFKKLASGEPIDARFIYGRPFEISDYPKLAVNVNELPPVTEHTEGFFRRFLIIPFDVHIPEDKQDKELANRIIATELSGVFNWVLEGLTRLLKNGNYSFCQRANDSLAKYRLDADNVGLFLQESGYENHATHYELLKPLYEEYVNFCYLGGYQRVNKSNFKKRLQSKQILISRHGSGDVVYIKKTDSIL